MDSPQKNEVKKKRSFGGKIDNFIDKEERAFEKRHLRAYIKGWKRFQQGRNPETKEPIYYDVIENWS